MRHEIIHTADQAVSFNMEKLQYTRDRFDVQFAQHMRLEKMQKNEVRRLFALTVRNACVGDIDMSLTSLCISHRAVAGEVVEITGSCQFS